MTGQFNRAQGLNQALVLRVQELELQKQQLETQLAAALNPVEAPQPELDFEEDNEDRP